MAENWRGTRHFCARARARFLPTCVKPCEIFDEPFNAQSLFMVVFVFEGELMERSSDEEDEEQSGSVLDLEDLGHILKAKVCPTHRQETALHIFALKYSDDIEIHPPTPPP